MNDLVTSCLVNNIHTFMSSDVPSLQNNYNRYVNNQQHRNDKINKPSKHLQTSRRIDMQITEQHAQQVFQRPLLVSLQRDQMLTNTCNLRNEIDQNMRQIIANVSSTSTSNNKVFSALSQMQMKIISVPCQVSDEEQQQLQKKQQTSSDSENYKSSTNCIDNVDSKNRQELFVANQASYISPSTLCTQSLSSSCTSLPYPHQAAPVPIPLSHSSQRKTTLSHQRATLRQQQQQKYQQQQQQQQQQSQHENCHHCRNILIQTPMQGNSTPTRQRCNDNSHVTAKNISNIITSTTITTNVNEQQSLYNINVDSIRDKWRKLAAERHLH